MKICDRCGKPITDSKDIMYLDEKGNDMLLMTARVGNRFSEMHFNCAIKFALRHAYDLKLLNKEEIEECLK